MAHIISPATAVYRGARTMPERWSTWTPRDGDILVCTPPKCGTTWTQTILAMLIHGGTDLPDKLGAISPWVDADLGVEAEEVTRVLAALPGRRVLKTHTPADGFPVWDGVHVVTVYRHPLDIFFSIRKHVANRPLEDNPMSLPVNEALEFFLTDPIKHDDIDYPYLQVVVHHYLETLRADRGNGLVTLHYADMTRDLPGTLRHLVKALEIDADDALIEDVVEATRIDTMRADAAKYAPVGGTGFWNSDAAFFATGGIGNWRGQLNEAQVARYDALIAELIPDRKARLWLEDGNGGASA